LDSFCTVSKAVCDVNPPSKYANSTLATIGSKDGRVKAIRIEKDKEKEETVLFETRQGFVYGEVAALTIADIEYRNLTVASSTGELFNFPLPREHFECDRTA